MKKAINTNYPVKFANRPFTTLYLQPKHQELFKYAPTEFRYCNHGGKTMWICLIIKI